MAQRLRRIESALVNCRVGRPLYYFEQISSTNNVLREKAAAGAPEGCVIIAGAQTAGRGRRGRQWLSLPGKGVYLSLLLRPHWPAGESPLISFATAVAVARALESFAISSVKLKWPNDILVQGRKIGGILIEPRISSGQLEFVVVGIGINVSHQHEDLQTLDKNTATSCLLEGIDVDIDQLIIRLLSEFDLCYYMILCGDKTAILNEWSRRNFNRGAGPQPVKGRQKALVDKKAEEKGA